MSTQSVFVKKRTIVRFIINGLGALALTGCASMPDADTAAAACPPVRTLVCESFGRQTRCTCADAARVDRDLERFAQQAPLGSRGW